MERAEAGWNDTEPTPRWRSLLDRARSAGRASVDESDLTGAYSIPTSAIPASPPASPPLPQRRPDGGHPDNVYQANGHQPDRGYPQERRGYADQPPGTYPTQPGVYGTPVPQPGYATPPAYHPPPAYQPSPAYHPPQQGYPPQSGSAPPAGGLRGRVEWRSAQVPSDGLEQVIATLRRDIGGSKVLAFANPKGGVHKTTATVLTAAAIGGVRGRGVLAWDDNELRGTLGLRAGSARHARTIRHLIHDLAAVEASHGEELTDRLDDFLRHASDGTYDVLAGEESPRFAQQLDPHTVRRVMEVLRRTHDVICVDTGNNVESANWRTVLQMADRLVITTVPREDAAFTADWMIDLLYDTGLGELAANAVTLLSCPTPNPSPLLGDLAKHFATRTRAVTVVPYDPALESGSSIDHTVLAPATKRAWLQASAVMLEPFGH